ncbi:hypothetical protein [Acinetobacter bereziniae]|uniref:hypothetical protein n=1 Tax=Acinetobacter bereziniae TaxID=106648 RepID=UPI00124FBA58|nr:hypothetical protein [Acinetobacter bereziniae]
MDKCREAFEKKFPIPAHWIEFDEKRNKYYCPYAADAKASEYQAMWEVWQSRQAEINQLQSQINEMAEVGLSQESAIREKDKRIEKALSELESLHNKKWAEWKEQADMHSQGEANAYEHAMQILERALRGEHE